MGLMELNGMERNPLLACEFCTTALMVLIVLQGLKIQLIFKKKSFNNVKTCNT